VEETKLPVAAVNPCVKLFVELLLEESSSCNPIGFYRKRQGDSCFELESSESQAPKPSTPRLLISAR
jgi:hypothetical protein